MLIHGKRALAYIVTVDELRPIEGYDRVEYARTNGWWVIVSKSDGFRVGDPCVYFEIDSRVPAADQRFRFLEKRNYKVKTIRMCGVYSQGLLMPITAFPELDALPVGTDVTEKLGVTYAVQEDNERKRDPASGRKPASLGARHPRLFKTKPIRWLMRRPWGRTLLTLIFGRKKEKPLAFPDFVKKTDEERVENQPWRVGDGKDYVLTEKLDGTSCTYAMKRIRHRKYEFYVCSRNVRQRSETQKTYHDRNIYWDLAFKYDIERHLREYLEKNPGCMWVCVQGEGVGSVQGNPLKLKEDDLYLFNFIDSVLGRRGSVEGAEIAESWGMKWVPILGVGRTQPTMEELKQFADGTSALNPDVLREGIVYRALDGSDSFKNVSRKYLLKHAG